MLAQTQEFNELLRSTITDIHDILKDMGGDEDDRYHDMDRESEYEDESVVFEPRNQADEPSESAASSASVDDTSEYEGEVRDRMTHAVAFLLDVLAVVDMTQFLGDYAAVKGKAKLFKEDIEPFLKKRNKKE